MSGKTAVVACAVMSQELEAVIGSRDIDLYLLEQGLHSTPKIMPERIQAKIDEVQAASNPDRILLGYGLCSNGVVGVGCGQASLIMPRCHDCISLLLGSRERYNEVFHKHPGTYYITGGWIREQDDPLSCAEGKYAQRLGPKKAMRAMELELINYTHICFIDNGVGDSEMARARARENCRVFKKEYMELSGSLDYFRTLIDGPPHAESAFVSLKPGQKITEDYFYDF